MDDQYLLPGGVGSGLFSFLERHFRCSLLSVGGAGGIARGGRSLFGGGFTAAAPLRSLMPQPQMALEASFASFGVAASPASRAAVAEREGFEPPLPVGKAVFKTAAFNRSATSPKVCSLIGGAKLYQFFLQKRPTNEGCLALVNARESSRCVRLLSWRIGCVRMPKRCYPNSTLPLHG